MRWWPQCAATCSGVRWSRVMSSISALYCRSCLTQSMWSPCAAMWIGDRPFWKTPQILSDGPKPPVYVHQPLIWSRSTHVVLIFRWIKSVTLVFAWMGAPWSSRISIILTWPFLAAQCRGVSSSWRERIFSDSLDGASKSTFRKRARLFHLGLGINLSSSLQQEPNHDHIPPPGRNMQRSDTVLHRKTDTLTQAHTSGAICGDGDWNCTNVGYFLPLG